MATPVADSVSPPAISNSNGTLTDELINGLVQGGSWTFTGAHELTYSFNLNDTSVSPWTPQLKAVFLQALAAWSNVANITFVEAGSGTVFLNSTADIAATLTGSDLQDGFEGAVGLGFFPDPGYADEFFAELGNDPYNRSNWPRIEGDVFFDDSYFGYSFLAPGGFALYAMLHELGHALGLKHPHDDGGNGRPDFLSLGLSGLDRANWTVMSYEGAGATTGNPASPMLADIAAIQYLYGANLSYRTGDDVYVISDHFDESGNTHFLDRWSMFTIWDAGGTDTIKAGLNQNFYIDLTDGRFSDFANVYVGVTLEQERIAIAYGAQIENAIGGIGDDWIFGNALANRLEGGEGGDYFEGKAGDDSIFGDAGGDYAEGGDGADWMDGGDGVDWFLGQEGNDSVAGGSDNDVLEGGSGNDYLSGDAGDDHLQGGSESDTLYGGAGADTLVGDSGGDYYVDVDAADRIYEASEYFTYDVITTRTTLTLPNFVEQLILEGDSDLGATGNALDNTIWGNTGDNLIDGAEGADTLIGGAGNDIYVLSDAVPGTLVDIVRSDGAPAPRAHESWFTYFGESLSGTYDPAPDYLNVYFAVDGNVYGYIVRIDINGLPLHTGPGSYSSPLQPIVSAPGDYQLTITPPSGAVPGLPPGSSFPVEYGELEIHSMVLGGTGWSYTLEQLDVTFTFHGAGYGWSGRIAVNQSSLMAWDRVIEEPDGGVDTVTTPWSHALDPNVENLVLTGDSDVDGSGNVLANVITGNAGSNGLNGGAGADTLDGGLGLDSLAGGEGDDTYAVSVTGTINGSRIAFMPDAVMEGEGEGSDTVFSDAGYTLPDGVENLVLTGAPMWRAYEGRGNDLDNLITTEGGARQRLYGEGGNDTLDGGAGADQLDGGAGDDVLVYDSADTVINGGTGTDTLKIAGAGITLDLTAISDGLIQDVEVIDLTGTGNNALTLTLADVLAISSTTDTLRIDGDAGDAVNGSGWTGGDVSGGYRTWTQGAATLLVDSDITANLL